MAIAGGDSEVFPPFEDGNEAEVRKRLLSIFAGRKSAVLIDNIDGEFNSPSLAACLTGETYSDRELGRSRTIKVNPRVLVTLTGNNLILKGDMTRRVLVSRIDPKCEHAHLRIFDFDPEEVVKSNQATLAADAITLLRVIHTHTPAKRLGQGRTASFDDWDDSVRQAICILADMQKNSLIPLGNELPELVDPIDAIDNAAGEDPELNKLRRLLNAIDGCCGQKVEKTIRDLVAECDAQNHPSMSNGIPSQLELREALVDIAGDPRTGIVYAKPVGKWMAKHCGRPIDGLRLRKGRQKNGTQTWFVEQV